MRVEDLPVSGHGGVGPGLVKSLQLVWGARLTLLPESIHEVRFGDGGGTQTKRSLRTGSVDDVGTLTCAWPPSRI